MKWRVFRRDAANGFVSCALAIDEETVYVGRSIDLGDFEVERWPVVTFKEDGAVVINKRISALRDQGYYEFGVGEFDENGNGTVAAEYPPPLYWATAKPVEREVVRTELTRVAAALSRAGVPVDCHPRIPSLSVRGDYATWHFGYVTAKTGASVDGLLLNETNEAAGSVDIRAVGAVPVLILMALAEPLDLHFADQDGNAVVLRFSYDNPWLARAHRPWGGLKALAAPLGMAMLSDVLAAAAKQAQTSVWF